ncbi:MAG TPA: haloalkane dehalogenase [Burkholderiales bacterium]|nr:haloalkane dehalogenase [Burkholderiales bacterium]
MRTPDSRFADLPGFPYAPRYLEWHGFRVHYVEEDEGKGGGTTFLCLHGEPTWSYLYRRMIPVFLKQDARVVAPDFIGFGRSDKPEDEALYTFDFHRRFLLDFVQRQDLKGITLVVQDWGGLLGLTLPMEMPERFERLLIMNTALAGGDLPLSEGFLAWRAYVARTPDLPCGKLMSRTCPHLTPRELAAYDAPFPDARYKAGARRFPQLVPERRDDPGADIARKARQWLSEAWQGESFMAIGVRDPVLGLPVMTELRKWIRGCPEPYLVENGGHFLQEWGEEVAVAALKHWS